MTTTRRAESWRKVEKFEPAAAVSVRDADTLLGGRLVVRQGTAGNRISTDTIFLAAAVPARAGERLLEVGSGTGGAAPRCGCRGARLPVWSAIRPWWT